MYLLDNHCFMHCMIIPVGQWEREREGGEQERRGEQERGGVDEERWIDE